MRNEFFPLRNESRPLGFMHNMVPALRKALPHFSGRVSGADPTAAAPVPAGMRYLVRGQYDSNPCRATCMLNPVYDLLPRMRWIADSHICAKPTDFAYDAKSDSLCCPSPNYCCPNSLANCADPSAVLFDAIDAGVPAQAVVQQWPLSQHRPFRWLMTPRSIRFVADAWRNATMRDALELQRMRPWISFGKLRKAGDQMEADDASARDMCRGPKMFPTTAATPPLCRGR